MIITGTAVDDKLIASRTGTVDGKESAISLNGDNYSFSECSLSSGAHTYKISVIDNHSPNGQETVTGSFNVGTTDKPPVIAMSNANNPSAGCLHIEGTATDDNSVSSVQVQVGDGGNWVNASRNGNNYSYDICGLSAGTHAVTVKATDNAGQTNTASKRVTISTTKRLAIFYSNASEHGDVKATCSGGKKTVGTSSYLSLGMDDGGYQDRLIVSFDTSSIPDDATIISATLKLKHAGSYIGNAYGTVGPMVVDIKKGCFSSSCSMEKKDWNAAASSSNVATIESENGENSGAWTTNGIINSTGLKYINKTGKTQFRIRPTQCSGSNHFTGYLKGDSTAIELDVTYQ